MNNTNPELLRRRRYEDLTPEEVQEYREKRKSFPMYLNQYPMIEYLSLEQKGAILTAMFEFEINGAVPEKAETDPMIYGYLHWWIDQEGKNFHTWVNTCLRNADNGRKAHQAQPNGGERNQTQPNATERRRETANSADKISQDKERNRTAANLADKISQGKRREEKESQDKTREEKARKSSAYYDYIERATDSNKPEVIPPTYNDVFEYCERVGIPAQDNVFDAEEFVQHYNSLNWKYDGKAITDWKPLIDLWRMDHEEIPF